MVYGERKELRRTYESLCDGSNNPLTEDEIDIVSATLIGTETSTFNNMKYLKEKIDGAKDFVPEPVAEAEAIGQLVAGSMLVSEIAPRLLTTVIKTNNTKYKNEVAMLLALKISQKAKKLTEIIDALIAAHPLMFQTDISKELCDTVVDIKSLCSDRHILERLSDNKLKGYLDTE